MYVQNVQITFNFGSYFSMFLFIENILRSLFLYFITLTQKYFFKKNPLKKDVFV